MPTIIIDSSDSNFISSDPVKHKLLGGLIKRELECGKNILVFRTIDEIQAFVNRSGYKIEEISHIRFYDKDINKILSKISFDVSETELVGLTRLSVEKAMILPFKYYSKDFAIKAYTIEGGEFLFTLFTEFGEFYYMNGLWFKLDAYVETFKLNFYCRLTDLISKFSGDMLLTNESLTNSIKRIVEFDSSDEFSTNLPELICKVLGEEYHNYSEAKDILVNLIVKAGDTNDI